MTAKEFLVWMATEKSIPWSRERKPPEGQRPSNGELHRWIQNKAVRLNGGYVLTLDDEVDPETVWMVEFFTGRARVTMPGWCA